MIAMPWVVLLSSYLLGAIPTAYIAGRLQGKNILQLGDRNVGAANAFRQLGAKTGMTVFLVDACKGFLAILLAQAASLPLITTLLAGTAAVIGHNWSVFIGFRGGRGDSTTIGVLLNLITQPMLIVAGPALATLLIRRNVILANCVLFIPLPLVCWWLGVPGVLTGYGIALPCLVGITDYVKGKLPVHVSGTGNA